MSVPRYYTIGAVSPDLESLKALDERLEDSGVSGQGHLVLVGRGLYHRRPQREKKILRMGLPERLAEEWQGAFPGGFALSLVIVPAELFDETQEAFLEDPNLLAP